MLQQGP